MALTQYKPLIVIPSPRDIVKVKEIIDCLPSDRLWLKYYTPEIRAYEIIEQEFLKQDYTHLIIIPDDLLVDVLCYRLLLNDIEHFPNDIISGYCNVDTTDFKNYANVTVEEVNDKRPRDYHWFQLAYIWEEANAVKQIDPEKYASYPEYMIDVKFAGFAMMAIPRAVFKNLSFRNDSKTGKSSDGCCLDVTFCWDAIHAGHRILCDLRLRSQHLKISDWKYDKFMAGVLPPYCVYDRVIF